MKTIITLLITLLISISSFAQQGINYKALIKDGGGNVVASQNITVQFQILQGVGMTNVYQETHTPTTDANGMVIANIGEGTLDNGVFADIDWGSDDHFLNVQVDIGSGLVDLGTTQFMAVPYALSSGDHPWSENANGIYTSDTNVGINSINPEHTLDIRSTSQAAPAGLNISNDDKSRYVRFFSGSDAFPDPSMSWVPSNSLLFATFDDNTLDFQEKMRISSLGDVGIGVTDPQAKLDILGGDWNLDAGNPGDLRIGNPTYNFRIGIATGGGGAGVTRMYTNSNALMLGANDTPSLILEPNGEITAPSMTNTLIENAGSKSLITKEYMDAHAASALEAIDEGNGIGYRIIERDTMNYGNIGNGAIDLSTSISPSVNHGATGNYSTAIGFRTQASGSSSVAMGGLTIASGYRSTAMGSATEATGNRSTALGSLAKASGSSSIAIGQQVTASGNISTAMGNLAIATGSESIAIGSHTIASGNRSTAFGRVTRARSYGETVFGLYNTDYTPLDSINPNPNDRLFVVGNGSSTGTFESDAFMILKNGTITAPSFDIVEITDAKALITKEYMDTNTSGLEAINEGNGIGYRIKGRDPANYGDIGSNAIDFSLDNFPSDTQGAIGAFSFASGYVTTSSAQGSTAMGIGTEASAWASTAMGDATTASAWASTAMGEATTASGKNSTALGHNTIASSYAEVAIGRYNNIYTPSSTTLWNVNDRLFVIGNGTGPGSSRSNALTVLKNGNAGFVTTNPLAKIHISAGNDTGLGNDNGFLLLGETNSTNISMDNNEIMARDNGVAADLNLQIEGGNVKIGGTVYIGDETISDSGNDSLRFNASLTPDTDDTNVVGNPTRRWRTVYAVNGTINTSDRREKKNIKNLHYGLEEVLQMQPVSFNWKNKNNPDTKLGLIAQDIQTLIPEVVQSHSWEIDEISGKLTKKDLERLGVYYSDLVPVLIKAIQEQNTIIKNQGEALKASNKNYEALLSRIETLEIKSSN